MGEKDFIDFLNSLVGGLNIGTLLMISVGGVSFIYGVITLIKKIRNGYLTFIKAKVNETEELNKKNVLLNDMSRKLTDLNVKVNEMESTQSEQHDQVNQKLNEIWENVMKNKDESDASDKTLEAQNNFLNKRIDDLSSSIDSIDRKTNLLINSDTENIKSFIIDKYYDALRDGYVPVRVLESLENRYEKYLQENGEIKFTYVAALMDKLRMMPNVKEETDDESNDAKSDSSNTNEIE